MPSQASTPTRPRILVPLDQSPASEKALAFAAALAQHRGGQLTLLAVPLLYHLDVAAFHPYPGGRRPPDYIAAADELIAKSVREAEGFLEDAAEQLRAQGLEVETQVVRALPATAIVEQALRTKADLIVMATRGRGGISRLAVGSVTDKVLQASDCPVLVLRGDAGRDPMQLAHLLVPLDGSALAEQCLDPAAALALAFGARLSLVQVVVTLASLSMPVDSDMLDAEARFKERVAAYLEDQASRLRERGLSVDTEVLVGEEVVDLLLDKVERDDVDLVAMTTHGQGGLHRWAFGSVADQLVRHSETPVLVVRDHG